MSIILILGLLGLEFFYIKTVNPSELLDSDVFGGVIDDEALFLEDSAFINNSSVLGELDVAYSDEDFAGFVLLSEASFLNTSSPVSDAEPLRNGLLSYRVNEGDSISTIAAEFGISVNTIIWANDIKDSSLIKPGQTIIVLPVSGILHEIKAGETLQSVASLYEVSLEKIVTINNEGVSQGDTVIVPSAKPLVRSQSTAYINQSDLPDTGDYFIEPIRGGWNWGRLHDGGAVDISASCGTQIVAAAEGVVVNVGSPERWNGGYGGFVKIEHPNGTKTLYTHNSENLVSIGDQVTPGEVIAKVGRTGRVSGTTGCHVHFHVAGAQNPFVR